MAPIILILKIIFLIKRLELKWATNAKPEINKSHFALCKAISLINKLILVLTVKNLLILAEPKQVIINKTYKLLDYMRIIVITLGLQKNFQENDLGTVR